jgi:hypothetical protein
MMRFQIEPKQQGALSFCFVFLWASKEKRRGKKETGEVNE